MVQTVREYLKKIPDQRCARTLLARAGIPGTAVLTPETEHLCDCFIEAEQYSQIIAKEYGALDNGQTENIAKKFSEYAKTAVTAITCDIEITLGKHKINLYEITAEYLNLRRQLDFAMILCNTADRNQTLTEDQQKAANECNTRIIETIRRKQSEIGVTTISEEPNQFEQMACLYNVYMRTPREMPITRVNIEKAVDEYLRKVKEKADAEAK